MGEDVGVVGVVDLEWVVGELWSEFQSWAEKREDVGLSPDQ